MDYRFGVWLTWAKSAINDPAKHCLSELIDEADGLKLLSFLAVSLSVKVLIPLCWSRPPPPSLEEPPESASLSASTAVYPPGTVFLDAQL